MSNTNLSLNFICPCEDNGIQFLPKWLDTFTQRHSQDCTLPQTLQDQVTLLNNGATRLKACAFWHWLKNSNTQVLRVATKRSISTLMHLYIILLIAASVQFALCSPSCRRPYTDTAELCTVTEDPQINYTEVGVITSGLLINSKQQGARGRKGLTPSKFVFKPPALLLKLVQRRPTQTFFFFFCK